MSSHIVVLLFSTLYLQKLVSFLESLLSLIDDLVHVGLSLSVLLLDPLLHLLGFLDLLIVASGVCHRRRNYCIEYT